MRWNIHVLMGSAWGGCVVGTIFVNLMLLEEYVVFRTLTFRWEVNEVERFC